MVKKLLPPLHEANQVPNLSSSGEWKVEDYNFLAQLANGLKIPKSDNIHTDLNSVPDVWARLLIVRNGLLNEIKSTINEWRGTLALVGLAPYYSHVYKLSSKIINLNELKNNPFSVAAQDQNDYRDFAKILVDVLPPDTVVQGQDWSTLGLLEFNNDPIAVFNPYTILGASKDYTGVKNLQNLPWYKDGYLQDPCKCKDITSEHYAILGHYLENLINSISGVTAQNTQVLNAVMLQLKNFKNDCQSLASTSRVSGYSRQNLNLNLPPQPIYDRVIHVFIGETGGKDSFDLGLMPRQEFANEIKGAIFADFKISQSTGKSLSELIVWDNYSLNSIKQQPELHNTIRMSCADKGYLYLQPEDIFTDKLCIFPSDVSPLKEHGKINNYQYAYPIKSNFMLFYDPTKIVNNFSLVEDGENYKASIILELVGGNGNTIRYNLEKIYKAKDIVKNRTVPNALSSWPDFVTDSWDQYYLFYDGNNQVNVVPNNIFAVSDIRNELQNLNGVNKIKFCKDLGEGDVTIGIDVPIQDSFTVTELKVLKSSPEAVLCSVVTQQKNFDVGLIIFPKPKKVNENSNQWAIGIDFGTSNSCVYFKENENDPKVLNFDGRINIPYIPGNTQDDLDEIVQAHKEFVPAQKVDIPFMTILRERVNKETTLENYPFRSNFIYYVDQVLFAIQDLPDSQRPLKFNLKWSQAEQDRVKVQYFLTQVVLQAAVEAAAKGIRKENLSFNFSYPEAFSNDQYRAFKSISKRSINIAFSNEEGINSAAKYRPESLSSALYFASGQKTSFTENVVTIDIGGGTSDVSIWQNLNLIWRNSLQLAGRDVLIKFLSNNLPLVQEISGNDELLQSTFDDLETIKDDEEKIRNGIELLVNSPEFSKAFSSRFEIVSGSDTGKKLRDVSEIALSGILYYISNVINHLVEAGNFDKSLSSGLKICLGGKASSLYKIIFQDEEEQAGIAKLVQKATKGVFKSISFEFTKFPKHEVSHGLLVNTEGATDLNVKEKSNEVVLGEQITIGSKSSSLLSQLDPAEKSWRISKLSELENYLELLQASCKIKPNVTAKFKNDMIGSMNAELVNTKARLQKLLEDSKAGGGEVSIDELMKNSAVTEPLFIISIKELIYKIIESKIKI